jgi:CBS domain containing-hemolysin-like protein
MPEFSEPPSATGSVKDTAMNGHSDTLSDRSQSNETSETNDTLNGKAEKKNEKLTFFSSFLPSFLKPKQDNTSLRDVIEEAMENGHDSDEIIDITESHERLLIANILSLRDMSVVDVMVPRADIESIDMNTPPEMLLAVLSEKQKSRFPVYRDTLDNVVGTVHIKDIIASLAVGQDIDLNKLIRDVPIVSPAMPVLDLLLRMRETKKHMALVVDEYGGIDGLVTIGDIIESIVGEIDDEYDTAEHPRMLEHNDGSITADARVDIEEFEERFGEIFSAEEREEFDTLGGAVFYIAGRVPARGEMLNHEASALEFEILEADPRRVSKVRIRNLKRPLVQ